MKDIPLKPSLKGSIAMLIPLIASLASWMAEQERFESTLWLIGVIGLLAIIYAGLSFNRATKTLLETLQNYGIINKGNITNDK